MNGRLYLRPVGLLYGDIALAAIAGGKGLSLAGSGVAFTHFDAFTGHRNDENRTLLAAPDLAKSDDPAIIRWIEQISGPRVQFAGISLDQPRLMGIVNVTPDSFSDGGKYASGKTAIRQSRLLAAEGADIIDIGGESTRPGAEDVSEEEEYSRVIHVVETLSGEGVRVSIDTRRANIMSAALEAGAQIVNDISALQFDAGSAAIVAKAQCPVILMHVKGEPKTMQNNPQYEDVVANVFDHLLARVEAAVEAGIDRSMIVADPGIGFGKTFGQNLELLEYLTLFHMLGVPILVGASRKGFIGAVTGVSDASERASGSVGAALASVMQGVQILRVHDVAETRQAIEVWRRASGFGEKSVVGERV
ncbi:MAG: dihydropteroate synthase [Rhizobiales bacterium]|nr:dihydropteroate synthase [Hyphomicrobiales bacterium]